MIAFDTDTTAARTRREFCACACRAAALLAAGELAACSSPTAPALPRLDALTATVNGRTVSVTIDGASPLALEGSAALLSISLGTFLIARPAGDSFTVLTARCTHQGCTVTGFENDRYVCPCHGSRYATDGTVVNGPATKSLTSYPSQFDGTVLTFTV